MEKLHIQPSELNMLPYYEYEYIISIYNDILKEREDHESKIYETEKNKYNIGSYKNLNNYKTPNLSSFKLPKI